MELNQRYIQADTLQDLSVKALYGNRYGVALVEKTRCQNHKARFEVFGNLQLDSKIGCRCVVCRVLHSLVLVKDYLTSIVLLVRTFIKENKNDYSKSTNHKNILS